MERPKSEHLSEKLSPRELEILGLLTSRKTKREISEALGISFHTVKTHIDRVYKKLGVTSRHEATFQAAREHITPSLNAIFTTALEASFPAEVASAYTKMLKMYTFVAESQLSESLKRELEDEIRIYENEHPSLKTFISQLAADPTDRWLFHRSEELNEQRNV